MKKVVKYAIITVSVMCFIESTYSLNAHSVQSYNNYCNQGIISSGTNADGESEEDNNLLLTFDANALMFRKNGIMKIGEYTDREVVDPYEVSGPGELAIDSVYDDRIYKVVGRRGEIDDSYRNEEWLTSSEKQRRKFELELEALEIGYRGEGSRGFGKYNLRPEKNLVPFLKFVDRFYHSADYRYGKTQAEIDRSGHFEEGTRVAELEELKKYHSKASIISKINDFKIAYKKCYDYEVCTVNNVEVDSISGESVFETLQDMFMSLVYLRPAMKELKRYYREEFNENINNITDIDRAAIISMTYDKFSDRVISTGDSDDNLTITMRIGDIYFPLIKDGLGLSVAERIYHYMIEIKYANNPDMQARWVAEVEKMLGSFGALDPEEYEKFHKAYLEAQKKYGRHTSPATTYDYGYVLTPEDFESTHKFDEARDRLARYLRSKFSTSSFFRYKDNANVAARNYMIVSKMVEDTAFSDITEIYCSDVELVTHSYGYESNEIMLADFTRAELNDAWGTDTDTDLDGLNDNVEAYEEELLDIRSFVEDYCNYNNIEGEERERYMREYGTTKVYNFISSPVLPDTDFDGRNDARDAGRPFHNDYKIETKSNGSDITVDFNMDYRYFFMRSNDYYADLSRMSAMFANAILKNNHEAKAYNVLSDGYNNAGIVNYMYWLGMEYGTYYEDNNETPYAIGHHDVRYLNNTKEVVALVIGEDEDYKDTLMANYNVEDIIHTGFKEKAEYIYEKLRECDSGGDKVYWLTGYGTGGSIANIIADRLIDDVGAERVYCYTFGARGVINIKNINERVDNAKNASIFNLINIDDISLADIGVDWYLYGRNASFSLSGDSKSKQLYNKIVRGKTYDLSNKVAIERLTSALDGKEMEGVMKKANKVMTSNIASYIASTLKEANRDIDKEKSEGKLIAYELVKNPKQYDLKKIYIEKAADREKPQYVRNVDNIVEVIRTVGNWYASNVYTYQAGTYGAESFSNATGIVTYYQGEQEQIYQDKFRESFRENWLKSSLEAKDNRRIYITESKGVPEDRVNLIMQDINVVDTVMNNTFDELNVDKLKQNERYTTNDRLTTKAPKIFGYYNNPFVNSTAQDDCSSFVSIVIYLFVNNNKDIKDKYQKVPNYTSARLLNNDTIREELITKGFECFDSNSEENPTEKKFKLERAKPLLPGDILVRSGHVEFYLGDNWSFGWGEVHNSFEDNPHSKDFKWHFGTDDEVENSNRHEGYYFYNLNKQSEGDYTRVYRYKGTDGD